MPKKALASLNVVINAVTGPLFKGLNKASKRLAVFGAKMKTIGRSISTSFTLPFAAIGVAGAKMAIDFQKNMTKINTLVGISASEVNKMQGEVMKLSGATAQAPADLADGLFFLTSAGLRGANAMQTLESVSKGVAIGLGEQTDLAKVAAAAQNAYGADTITASKALDVFGMSVQQGMFEASDLAEVLGTQLGLASSLGISFEETNAFIATYTKTTGDAKSASTSFGGVMMALAKTTPQMERALNQVGMTGDSVRASLGENGLRQTLIDIKAAFEAQGVPLTQFFSKSQALKGVLGVLGNQTETYGEVLEGMHNSVGMVDDGFNTLENTAGFKMQKAFTNLKNAAMELGAMLMPIFTAIVDGAVKLGSAFTELDGGTKKLLVGAAALFAFSGPLMTLAGGLVSAIGAILSPVGLVVIALGLIFKVIYDNWASVRKTLVDFINYFIDLYNESIGFRTIVEGFKAVFLGAWATAKFFIKSAIQAFKNFGNFFKEIFGSIGDIIKGVFTLDTDLIKSGIKDLGKGVKKTFTKDMDDIKSEYNDTMTEIGEGFSAGVNRTDKVEFITEEDVQRNVDNVNGWLQDKMGKAKNAIQGLIGGGSLGVPDSGGDPVDPTSGGGDDGTKDLEKTIQKKKSILQSYLDWAKTGYEGFADKVGEVWDSIANVAGSVLSGISNLWAAEAEKQNQILANEETEKQTALDQDFARQEAIIENSTMNQAKKDEALTKLKEKFDEKQGALDKKMDDKKKALQKKQAIRDKQMKIASAIMSTAQAVVQALTAGPIAGPILAGIVGGLGAAQIAAIASTPIPLAKGGLAFGPTNAIVGDNPNAANDPEVVAPLSKLKGMLGGEMNVSLNVGGVLKGSDIFLANEADTEARERYI
jgi:TP901 family phage tail tape measure protein